MRSSRQFSFLNSPKKLVFVHMYGSTITGLMGPPFPHCLLVAFCAFLCFFVLFGAFGMCKILRKKNEEFKTALITPFTI